MLFLLCRSVVLGFFLVAVGAVGVVEGGDASFSATPVSQVKPDPEAVMFYVAPTGKDTWSGRLAEPNEAGTDGPLATIRAARDKVREFKKIEKALIRVKRPVTVLLRGGTYTLDETLHFTDADSGSREWPITYQAYPGETPIVSGGTVVTGWQPDDSQQSKTKCEGKLWRADLSKVPGSERWDFNQLFVDDQRRPRARTPNLGSFLRTDGPIERENRKAFYFKEGDLKQWKHLDDVLVVVYHSWETSLHHIESIDAEKRQVTFREPAPWRMAYWEKQQRYYVENVFEGLDTPGEWYWDRAARVLYYYPLPGETRDRVKVVVPHITSTLVQFDGQPAQKKFVEHLRFRGISFRHTNADVKEAALHNPSQAELGRPAMIMAVGLRDSIFESCEVAHAGGHAIWLAAGCKNDRVERCHLHDLAGGGVYIGGGSGIQETAPTDHITVDNCFIHDGGHLFHGAHGVWIGRSSYNKVTHNEISNFDYTGISCGWSWGFQPSSANHNNLDYNHIHHLGNGSGLSDMGGIYTLGISPGTTERYNHIHDIYHYPRVSHGSGIYPDEGSSDILIENNVVHRVGTCPFFQHYGKNNLVRNNVLAFGEQAQIRRCREGVPCHFIAEGNILYSATPQIFSGIWNNGGWKLGRNIYWSTTGRPNFMGLDFEKWAEQKKDVGSLVTDPLFVDPAKGDFRLKENSPALKHGFKPIDLSRTGLHGDSSWTNLPQHYENRPRSEKIKPKPLRK
ncbi:MAG: right-handed parallel beta-helix repeat-containing protein [Planctomycetia bacterium]|jgi:hypothetical protein